MLAQNSSMGRGMVWDPRENCGKSNQLFCYFTLKVTRFPAWDGKIQHLDLVSGIIVCLVFHLPVPPLVFENWKRKMRSCLTIWPMEIRWWCNSFRIYRNFQLKWDSFKSRSCSLVIKSITLKNWCYENMRGLYYI